MLEEKIKVANHRIDDLERRRKNEHGTFDAVCNLFTYGDWSIGVFDQCYHTGNKRDAGVEKIQTNAVALVVALILCPLAVVILCIYFSIQIIWYYIVRYDSSIYSIFSGNRWLGKSRRDVAADEI